MNEALREQFEAIGTLFVRSTGDFARRGYEIGTRVRTLMKNPRSYGAKAVEVVAKALGKKPGVLYDAAKVAGSWTEAEFLRLLDLPNRYRQPLSFSHFVLLAEAGKRRDELVKQALSEGWSVRELRRELFAAPKTASKGAVELARRTTKRLTVDLEKVMSLLPELPPDAVEAEVVALRALQAKVAGALATLQTIQDQCPPSSSKSVWGDLGRPGEA